MKFKLDENFGTGIRSIFEDAGYETCTVRTQNLAGCSDVALFKVCTAERYCLVTLDKDFSDITRFPARNSSGIVVIRPPPNAGFTVLTRIIRQFIEMLPRLNVADNLLIVEFNRIRIHQYEED